MTSLIGIYIATAVISVIIAVLLANMARLSGRARVKSDKKGIESTHTASGVFSEDSLRKAIFKRVNEVLESELKCQQVSKKVADFFDEELTKRINLNVQEVEKQYKNVLEEKNKTAEMALNKYEKVLDEKRSTETVIRSIAEGLVVVDDKGKVVMMNPAAERLLGVSAKDKIGKSVTEDIKDEQLVTFTRDLPTKEGREIELVSQQDETKKILRASSGVIEDKNGETVGMVSVLSDITKHKELDRLKSDFLANVSHELRTPLIAIEKSLNLILTKAAGEVSETQEQFLSMAHRNLKRLGLLINDLLDFSKLEAGKMQIKRELVPVKECINLSLETFGAWAKTKSINLRALVPEDLPEVNIDSNKITQVLTNLIGNAIKFTPKDGTITVEAILRKETEEVEVSVRDTGVGIAREKLGMIFDKFYQVGERMPTDMSGTGIGLSVAKDIVSLHGGRMWAESEKNQGAKFIFTLPLKSGLSVT